MYVGVGTLISYFKFINREFKRYKTYILFIYINVINNVSTKTLDYSFYLIILIV